MFLSKNLVITSVTGYFGRSFVKFGYNSLNNKFLSLSKSKIKSCLNRLINEKT